MRRLLAVLAALLMLSSCAHVISRETLKRARTDVPFSAVAADPFFFKGSLFVWGGTIVATSVTRDGSVIEVVQAPLGTYGAVSDSDASQGRFLVRTDRFLDPLIYEKGREITVAGVLVGSEKRPVGETSYRYPVLEAREIYLWKEEEPYYYPYYYDYPWYRHPRWYGRPYYYCDPFWDPWCRYP